RRRTSACRLIRPAPPSDKGMIPPAGHPGPGGTLAVSDKWMTAPRHGAWPAASGPAPGRASVSVLPDAAPGAWRETGSTEPRDRRSPVTRAQGGRHAADRPHAFRLEAWT